MAFELHPYRLSLGGALSLIHLAVAAWVTVRMQVYRDTFAYRAFFILLAPYHFVFYFLSALLPLGVVSFCVLMPLNSYLWGHTLAALWRRTFGRRPTLRDRRMLFGQGPDCGYDLRGSRHSDRCPECGEPIPAQLQAKPTPLSLPG